MCAVHHEIQRCVLKRERRFLYRLYKLDKSIPSGVVEPWVVVGTPDASVKVKGLTGELLGGKLAPVSRVKVCSLSHFTELLFKSSHLRFSRNGFPATFVHVRFPAPPLHVSCV